MLFALLLVLAPAADAQCTTAPREFYIDDSYPAPNPVACQYQTIAQVLALGPASGDIYNIANGYYGLNHNLTVSGTTWIGESERGVVINASGTNFAPLAVRASNTNLTNLTFNGYQWGLEVDYNGGAGGSSNRTTVENVSLNGPSWACICWGHNLTLRDITARAQVGVYNQNGWNFTLERFNFVSTTTFGAGVYAFGTGSVTVVDSYIDMISGGVALQIEKPVGSVRNVTTNGTGLAVFFYASVGGDVSELYVRNWTATGLYLGRSGVYSVRDVVIAEGSGQAIVATNTARVTMQSVSADRCTTCLMVTAGATVTVRDFTAANATYGIQLQSGSAMNASSVTLMNISTNPIYGSGTAILNLSGAVVVDGSDNILWTSTRPLTVRDSVLASAGDAGIQVDSSAGLTLLNVTFLDSHNYAVYCNPCGGLTWLSGAVNNSSYGVYSFSSQPTTIRGVNFTNLRAWAIGLWSWGVDSTAIENTTIVNATYGMYIGGSVRTRLAGNTFVNIPYEGVSMWDASYSSWADNAFLNVTQPLVWEPYWSDAPQNYHDIPTSNTVDGKPIYYLLNVSGFTVPSNASLLIFINCTNITADSVSQTNAFHGVIVTLSRNIVITNSRIVGYGGSTQVLYTEGFTMQNVTAYGAPTGWSAGLYAYESDNMTLRDLTIQYLGAFATGDGVSVQSSEGVTIERLFTNNVGSSFNGFSLVNLSIRDSAGANSAWMGFECDFCTNGRMTNVTAINTSYGVYLYYPSTFIAEDLFVRNASSVGIYLYRGGAVRLSFVDSVLASQRALYVYQTNNLTVTNGTFGALTVAPAYINAAPDFRAYNSTFVGVNASSFQVVGASPGFLMYHNNFYGGSITNAGGVGTWDFGYPTAGNFYSWAVAGFTDYFTGVAQSTPGKDGIADQNYTVGGAARDYYPLMDPWPPGISLTSPANGAVIQAGTPLNFSVSNFFDAASWSDSFGGNSTSFSYPHDLNTTGWADGWHNITVAATDGVAPTAVRSFSFEFDSTDPLVVTTPALGSASVARGARINITVTDVHLNGTLFIIDGGLTIIGSPTYSVDTTGWSVGNHWILIAANDTAGNLFLFNWSFYLDGAAPTLGLFDPAGVLFVPPGTRFTYDASDEFLLGTVEFTATGLNATGPYSGALAPNVTRFSVDTSGWADGCYDLSVTAYDDAGHATVVAQQVCVDGTPPDLFALMQYSADEDVPFTFPGADVVDLDWLPTYTWEFDPDLFLALQTLTGRSPAWTFNTPGTISVHLIVVDRAGNLATTDFSLTIVDVTPPTAVFSLPGSAPEDVNVTLDATGSSDNDPAWAVGNDSLFSWTIEGPTGTITLSGATPSVNLTEPGNHTVTLTVRDPTGLTASLTETIFIQDRTAPAISVDGLEAVINEGGTIYFDASPTTDNLPGDLTFVWSFIYDGSPGTVAGDYLEFTFDVPGTYTITLSVTDASANVGTLSHSLRVNDNPSLGNSPLTQVAGGQAYSWQMQIVDGDAGDTHSFDLVEGPTGLQVSPTGLVQWSPSAGAYGVHRVHIAVYDDYGYLDVVYVITVTRPADPDNRAPAFTTFPLQSVAPGATYTYGVQFSDPDGDSLTLALASGPEGMTLDAGNTLRWDVPTWVSDGEMSDVSLALSDGLITVHQNFTLRARAANAAAQFVSNAFTTSFDLQVGGSTSIPLGPGVATDSDDPYADLAFFVVVSEGDAVEAAIVIIDGTPTLVITALKPGVSTVTLRVADPSGAGDEVEITARVAGTTPAGGDVTLMLLLLAAIAGAGVVALVLVKRRRPGDEGAVAMAPPTVGAEEVQVDVVEQAPPAPPAPPARKPPVPPAAVAVGAGAAAAGAAAAAASAAVPPAVGKPSKAATYTIEGLFIIYQDGRMIFSKTDLGAEQLGDPELVSSMFTAVQQFIKDSFSAEGELNKMGYGDNQIFIERGSHLYMAAIAFGEPDKELQEKMQTAIEKIEYSYAGVVEAWDGQTNRFSDIEKYVVPVLALTAGITRGDVLAATTTRDVKVLSQLEFFQGFVRLKVGVKNDTEAVITKVTLDIDYNEDVLRLQRIEPASYKTSGARVMLNVLNPGEKSSVAFYFDPQICTETNIDGIVRFRDYKGVLSSVTMKTRKAEVVCPLFFTKEHANTAMLKRLIETELGERDSKIYTITKLPPYVKHKDVFEVCKQVVLSHDVHMVREFLSYNPFSGEAWFYGETKVKGYKIVIRTAVREDNMIEFFAASTVIKAVTGLLAEFNHTLISMVMERYSDVKIEQIYDEGTKHQIQAKALVDKLGEGEATAGETDQ